MSFRPESFEEFTGQELAKKQLKLMADSAMKRGEAMPHVLLSGPAGLGKTTLAYIVARYMGVNFHITSGPVLEKAADIAAVLARLEEKDVLFIDEIHRLPRHVEEVLYPALEDYKLDLVVGGAASSRVIRIDLPPFTLIGATTRPGLLTPPLRDRFRRIITLEYYSGEDLANMAKILAEKMKIKLSDEARIELGRRARGVARQLVNLILAVRDYATVNEIEEVDVEDVRKALEVLGIDSDGLTNLDMKVLRVLAEKFGGGPVGIATLAAAVGEEKETLEEVYEPFLLRCGYIKKTNRGRELTLAGWEKVRSFAGFSTFEKDLSKEGLFK